MKTKRANRLFLPAAATVVMLLVAACQPGAIPASLNAGQPSEATQSVTATADTSEGGIIGAVEAMGPAAWTISGKEFEVTPETTIKGDIQVGDYVKADVEPGTSRLKAVSLASDSGDVNGNDDNENVNDNANGNEDNEDVNENENETDDDGDEANENVNDNANENDDNENVNDTENENDDDKNENVSENDNEHDDDGGENDKGNDNGKGNDDGGGDHEGGDD